MAMNINMRRVQTRIAELFKDEIDLSDLKSPAPYTFETRSLAAFALVMLSGLDIQQACAHITDGYHDLGIDALYLDEKQKKLFVVQSKWRADGSGGIAQEEMLVFVQALQRVLDENLAGANTKIQAKIMDVDTALTQMGYQIQGVFIHTGNQNANSFVLKLMEDLMSRTNDEISSILSFEEISFKNIYEFLSKGQEQQTIDIADVILNNWGKIETPYTAYYGTVSAVAVGEWYNTYGNFLFEKNIRFYKGNTEVNEGMKKVLLQEPEKFYYYNNGLKLLCRKIQRKAKKSTTNETGLFALEGVSLVNGAQTAGTIGALYTDHSDQLAKANVMVQIIDLSNIDVDTSTQITRLSNTQNRIENKDFAALDIEQERLRQELVFSHYGYLYKSGDKMTNPDNQISFDEGIVALACLHEDITYAVLAKRNVGALSEDITKAPYKVLINGGTNSFVLLNTVLYMREVEKYLQEKKTLAENNRERLIYIHGNRVMLHLVLQVVKMDANFYTTILDCHGMRDKVAPLIDDLESRLAETIERTYPESYPANIFKNVQKCKEIETAIKSN